MSEIRENAGDRSAGAYSAWGVIAFGLGASCAIGEQLEGIALIALIVLANVAADRSRTVDAAIWAVAVMSVGYFGGRMIAGPYELFSDQRFIGEAHLQSFVLVSIGLFLITLPVLIVKGVQQARQAADESGRAGYSTCGECDYDLRGNTSGVCPECGTRR